MLSLLLLACTSDTPAPVDDTWADTADTGAEAVDPYLNAVVWQESCASPGAECGVLTVPVDWADPDGPTLQLAVARVRASGGASQGTLFASVGSVSQPQVSIASDVAAYVLANASEVYDVVLMDARGAHGSQPLACGDALEAAVASAPVVQGADGVDALLAWQTQVVDACAQSQPDLVDHMGPGHRADDLDLLRRALNQDTLHLYVQGFAAPVAVQYAHRYPEHTGRMLIDTPSPVLSGMSGLVGSQAESAAAVLADWAAWCTDTPSECPVSEDPMGALNQVYTDLEQGTAQRDGEPVPWAHAFWGLLYLLASEPGWLDLGDLLADRDASGLAQLGVGYFDGRGDPLAAFYLAQCSNDGSIDDRDGLVERAAASWSTPFLAQFDVLSRGMCTALDPQSVVSTSTLHVSEVDPSVVFQATLSPWEPVQIGHSLAAQIDGAVVVEWETSGATAQAVSPCMRAIGDAYLLDGVVPDAETVCRF